MKRATSIVQGSLRLVALVITIVTVATFSTVGYSAYREYNALVSPQSSQSLRVNTSVVGEVLRLSVTGAIPNDGFYPLVFSIALSAKSHGTVLSQSVSQPVRIVPREVKNFSISLDINPYATANKTAQSELLTNGGQIILATGIRANIEPFAGIKVEGGSNLTLPALLGHLTLGAAKVSHAQNATILTIPVSFSNEASFPFPFRTYGSLLGEHGSALGNSSAFAGTAPAGRQTAFNLVFTFAGQTALSGDYPLELEFTIGGLTVPVHTHVRVSG